MDARQISIRGALIFLVLVMLSAVQWRGNSQLLDDHEVLSARRIVRFACALIDRAHQSKDDLLIQQTVQAVAQVPGVSFAAVVDVQNKIIAHSEPAKLGQTLRPRSRLGLWSHSLESGREEWGKLVFGFSDSPFHQAVVRRSLLQLSLLFLAALAAFGFFIVSERNRQAQQARFTDLEAMLAEEKNRVVQLEAKVQIISSQGQSWLMAAASRISYPVLFLDARQRLFAYNDAAAELLQFSPSEKILGKSWQDIPLLSGCGKNLTQSLSSSGRPISCVVRDGDLEIRFNTLRSHYAGTWVSFFARHVVK